MKTETMKLKHLAPYLPYGLTYKDRFANKIWPVHLETADYLTKEAAKSGHQLVLRPLSDLTKTIEHNGEKFVPSERIAFTDYDQFGPIKNDKHGQWFRNRITGEWLKPQQLRYWEIRFLFEWHFDVFGLIEEGLAIDLNSIKEKVS